LPLSTLQPVPLGLSLAAYTRGPGTLTHGFVTGDDYLARQRGKVSGCLYPHFPDEPLNWPTPNPLEP